MMGTNGEYSLVIYSRVGVTVKTNVTRVACGNNMKTNKYRQHSLLYTAEQREERGNTLASACNFHAGGLHGGIPRLF